MKDFRHRLASVMMEDHITNYKLAKECGISASTVSNWLTGATIPDATKISVVCEYLGVNKEWLLSGTGNMRKSDSFQSSVEEPSELEYMRHDILEVSNIIEDNDPDTIAKIADIPKEIVIESLKQEKEREKEQEKENWIEEGSVLVKLETRPRIPLTAIAGSLSEAPNGVTMEDCEQLPVVHQFPSYDFTMLIKGDSMSPKYESGDEVACRKIDQNRYIQWGKVHVLDTTQGIIIKRVYEDGDKIRCVSYNKEYADFSIPKEDIYSMSLVVGVLSITEM